jgi:hypothetical protein
MKFSLKSAITLLLVMSITAGILLYPARASCIDILQKDSDSKSIDPFGEPNIHCAEPGESPVGSMGTLGSSQGTSIDALQPDMPYPDSRGNKTTRPRYMQMLFFYLRIYANGPFKY